MGQPTDSWQYLEKYVEPEPEPVIIDATPTSKPERLDVISQRANEKVVNFGKRINQQVGKLPSPGGIGALLVILLILVMILVPVGGLGETRLQLMFDVLRGARGLPLPVTVNSDQSGGTTPGVTVGPFLPLADPTTSTGGATTPALPQTQLFPLGNFGEVPAI